MSLDIISNVLEINTDNIVAIKLGASLISSRHIKDTERRSLSERIR